MLITVALVYGVVAHGATIEPGLFLLAFIADFIIAEQLGGNQDD